MRHKDLKVLENKSLEVPLILELCVDEEMADVAVNQHQTMCLQINLKFTMINIIKLIDGSLGEVLFQEVVERIILKERNIATVVDILSNSCCHIIITTEIKGNLTFQRALK